MKKTGFLIFIAFYGIGCSERLTVPVDTPPSAPTGLYSVTGDGKVTLYWNANREPDLKLYALYTSDEPNGTYELVGTTTHIQYTFNIPNGVTKYLAVVAIDYAGNESELSRQTVWDTPRPEGRRLFVYAFMNDSLKTNFDRCGIDFSDYDDQMVQSLDNPSNDVYIDNYENVIYLNAFTDDTDITQFGKTEKLNDVDYIIPDSLEWAENGYVPLVEDYSYVIWTYDNHFAAIRVLEVYPNKVIFEWAYQTDPGNPQLKISAGNVSKEKERKLIIHIPKKQFTTIK